MLFIVMLALGIRVLFVPVHLAQDEHLQSSGHLALHASETEGEAADGHEHGSDHPPHSALDLVSDLLLRRTPQEERTLVLSIPPQRLDARLFSLEERPATRSPEPSPPKSRSSPAAWSRGPPATA